MAFSFLLEKSFYSFLGLLKPYYYLVGSSINPKFLGYQFGNNLIPPLMGLLPFFYLVPGRAFFQHFTNGFPFIFFPLNSQGPG